MPHHPNPPVRPSGATSRSASNSRAPAHSLHNLSGNVAECARPGVSPFIHDNLNSLGGQQDHA